MKKRVLLNVICIGLIIISIIGSVLVINDARTIDVPQEDMIFENMERPIGEGKFNEDVPPAKPEGEMPQGGNMGERPEKTEDMERPERPSGEMEEGMRPEMPQDGVPFENEKLSLNEVTFNVGHIIILSICVTLIVVNVWLLIATRLWLHELNLNYVIKIIIVSLIVGIIFGFILYKARFKLDENTNLEELLGKDIPVGEIVNSKNINLDKFNSNITIKEAGEYNVSGKFKYSILIDSNGEVILNLNNVEVNSKDTAAIANISKNQLIVNLVKDSKNILTDGGYSEYDGCLYSNGSLIIKGKGTLEVNGKQNEGEGIATTDNDITIEGGNIIVNANDDGLNAGGDNGGTIEINNGTLYVKASGDGIDSNGNLVLNGGTVYAMGSSKGGDAGLDADKGITLNGGTIIALGSDMLETPRVAKQNYLAVRLNSVISVNENITLLDEDGNVIISFVARESFRTLIISNDKLSKGTYQLYKGGSNNGKLDNNIYYNGEYSKGTLVQEININ